MGHLYRQTVAAICGLVIVYCTPVAVGQSNDTTAMIAAWNVKDVPAAGHPRVAEIARGIVWLDPEVIVLSEAGRTMRMTNLANVINAQGGSYTPHISVQTAGDQIAILAKQDVTVSNVRLLPGSDDGNQHLRRALLAEVRVGQFDFVLVGLHLKAGRSSGDRTIRSRQCAVIANFITMATAGVEKDVLVIGDYNMIPVIGNSTNDEANFEAMNPSDYLQFVSSEDLFAEGSHISSNGQMGNLLDGYSISYDHTNEYIEGSLRIFPLHRTFRLTLSEFRRNVSDHLPLVARFQITVDDDVPPTP